MGCQHTVAKLLQASSFVSAGNLVRRARDDTERQLLNHQMETMRKNSEMMQQMIAMRGYMAGVPLVNAGQSSHQPTTDAQLAVPTESGSVYDELKGVVRQYGSYDCDHHVVFDSLVRVLGNLPLGPSATPADALALAVIFGVCYTVLTFTDSLPTFSTDSTVQNVHDKERGAENLNEVLQNAAHFVFLSDEAAQKLAQKMAKNQEPLRLAAAFLKLVCFQKRPSAAVVDLAFSTFLQIDKGIAFSDLSKYGTALLPLSQFVPYVMAVRAPNSSLNAGDKGAVVTMIPDGRILVDDVPHILVGFSQQGLVLSSYEDSENTKENNTDIEDLKRFGVEFYAPYVVVAQASLPDLPNVCAACQLSMERFQGSDFLYTMKSAIVTADLCTASNVCVCEDGRTDFQADGLIWDTRFERVVRIRHLKFEADVFDLNTLMPLSNERLSALVPSATIQSKQPRMERGAERGAAATPPFPTCRQVRAQGLQVMALLFRASDYAVDETGRVVSVRVAGDTLFAARNAQGTMLWSREAANHAFTLCDVV